MLAQVAGGDGLTSVLTTVGQYGIAAVFIFLYFQERKEKNATVDRERAERQAAQATLAAFVDKHATVLKESLDVLKDVKDGLTVQVDKATAAPSRMELLTSRLELAADDLRIQAERDRRRHAEENRG